MYPMLVMVGVAVALGEGAVAVACPDRDGGAVVKYQIDLAVLVDVAAGKIWPLRIEGVEEVWECRSRNRREGAVAVAQ